jgi:hypothetical protein
LAGRVRVRRGEIGSRYSAAEGLVWSLIDQVQLGSDREAGEVDDHVGSFGQSDQQLVELDGRRQVAALGADLPQRQRRLDRSRRQRIGDDLEDHEAGVAAVHQPQPVAARFDLEDRPGPAVDDESVAERLRIEDR